MAEAFARLHGANHIEAFSAGSKPAAAVHPLAIVLMAERGCDISARQPKSLDAFKERKFDCAVTMGCGDDGPSLKAKSREDWDIPDPWSLDEAGYRRVRNLVEKKVQSLLARLLYHGSPADKAREPGKY